MKQSTTTLLFLLLFVFCSQVVNGEIIKDCSECSNQCVGGSGQCCGITYAVEGGNETATYCTVYCLEEGRTCCGCNPLSDGTYHCFGCPTDDKCFHNTDPSKGLEYYCVNIASTCGWSLLLLLAGLFLSF